MTAGYESHRGADAQFGHVSTDQDLEAKIYSALRTNCFLQSDTIVVRVSARRVFLEGIVRSENERKLAQECISEIFGIRAITNYITYHRH